MADTLNTAYPGLTAPAADGLVWSPSSPSPLPTTCRAIYVGGSGNLQLTLAAGTTMTFFNVPAGAMLPVRARDIVAAGTTATGVIALW